MRRALSGLRCDEVPLWEVEFQLWDKFSDRPLILGRDFERLSAEGRGRAIGQNAEVMAAVGDELGFSAISPPGGYWEHAPGQLAYFVLPGEEAVFAQLREMRRLTPPERLLVGRSICVMGMPSGPNYLEFCYQLHDRPDAFYKV